MVDFLLFRLLVLLLAWLYVKLFARTFFDCHVLWGNGPSNELLEQPLGNAGFITVLPQRVHRSGFVCCGGVAELTLEIIACRAVDSHLVAGLGVFVRDDENVKHSPKTGPRAWRLRR